ncbi:hypothetical protein PybrP1_009652 [[Pythium] brassicae (nom. inval.)]|nr:hypothetical protein PybrP1_009652 [[Pythium] brassicae (nom. inval.)]
MTAPPAAAAAVAGTPSSVAPRRRNQYSLEFKLEVARQYAPGVLGCGFEALARQHNLNKSNVMAWVAKKEQLAARVAATRGSGGGGGDAYRLDGCGRKSSHRELEDKLERWLRAQEADGECVRDKDIKAHAMRIFRATPAAKSAAGFKASSGWLARFKQRKNIAAVRRASRGGDEPTRPHASGQAQVATEDVGAAEPQATEAVSEEAAVSENTEDDDDRSSGLSAEEDDDSEATALLHSGEKSEQLQVQLSQQGQHQHQQLLRRLDELTQQIGHLVHGQSLLLGVLQRLAHPVGSSVARGGPGPLLLSPPSSTPASTAPEAATVASPTPPTASRDAEAPAPKRRRAYPSREGPTRTEP